MICIRVVVNHDDNDADDVATVVEIIFATDVACVENGTLSFAVASQSILITSEVAFSKLNSSNGVMIAVSLTFSQRKSVNLFFGCSKKQQRQQQLHKQYQQLLFKWVFFVDKTRIWIMTTVVRGRFLYFSFDKSCVHLFQEATFWRFLPFGF